MYDRNYVIYGVNWKARNKDKGVKERKRIKAKKGERKEA